MTRRSRGWTAGLVAAITAMGSTPAESGQLPTIEVLVVNAANVPEERLQAAEREATRIYAGIGVRLGWITNTAMSPEAAQETSKPSSSLRLTMIITQNPIAGIKDPGGKLMGLATGTDEGRGTLAYAFYQRIRSFAGRVEISVARALGHVMAHEIGHLMLPFNAHSASGIMRADWDRLYMDRVARGAETFTAEEAALIRHRLAAGATTEPHQPCDVCALPCASPATAKSSLK